MKHLFNWIKNNFNSVFSHTVSLGAKVFDNFLTVLKMLPCYEWFFGNFIFALVAWTFSRNHLNMQSTSWQLNTLLQILRLSVCWGFFLWLTDASKADVLELKVILDAIFRAFPSQSRLFPASKRCDLRGNDALVYSDHAHFHSFRYTPDLADILWEEISYKKKENIFNWLQWHFVVNKNSVNSLLCRHHLN